MSLNQKFENPSSEINSNHPEITIESRAEPLQTNNNTKIDRFRNLFDSTRFKNPFKRKSNLDYYVSNCEHDDTTKKEDFRIAICRDGKFVVTFKQGKVF